MRKLYLLAAAAAVLLVPCCQEISPETIDEEPVVETPAVPGTVASITAVTENSGTKTGLSRNGDVWDVVWKEGDAMRLNAYRLTLDENQPDGYGPGTAKAVFKGSFMGNPSSPRYRAWYPEALGINFGYLSLPSEQVYAADDINGFPMYAESNGETLQFKNLCGAIRLNLKGSKNISAIGLLDISANPKGLSGSIDITDNTAVVKSGTAGVTLSCPTPVALDGEDYTSFFISVPAGSYEKLQITVSADDETYAILKSNTTIAVDRSKVTEINIPTLKFKNDKAKITYTTTNTTQLAKYNVGADASVFGEGLTVVSHTYDAETKTGVIILSGTVTKIGQYAFSSTNLKTITIPESVTEIEREGFYDSRSLTTINWPASLTSVGYRAFSMDMALTTVDLSHLTYIGAEAFFNCAPESVTVGANINTIGTDAFRGGKMTSVVVNAIPETMLGGLFYDCANLVSATFNCDVPSLPAYIFHNCDKLASVTFNGSLGEIGEKAFYSCAVLTDGISLDGTGITSIGSEAFHGTPLSSSFDIPATVTSIGHAAFCECPGLAAIHIPDASLAGNSNFMDCANLESVTFTGATRTTSIPYHCFKGCTKLSAANIPSSATSVGEEAFTGCGLTAMPDGWGRSGITYGSKVFSGCPITHITFPDNWTKIPSQFCHGMASLATVDFGSGLTSLGNQAFNGCWALTSVTIPANVTSLTSHSFYRCGVQSVTGMNRSDLTIGDSVFSESKLKSADISNWATVPVSCFKDCADLSSVTLGEGLTRIDNNAFQGCSSLTSVSLPSTLTQMGSYAFSGTGLTSLPAGLHQMTFGQYIFKAAPITSVAFPAGMTSTGEYMFANCASLESVDLRDVTSLEEGTFLECGALESVNFRSVTTLKKGCFNGCKSLTSVTLPNSLEIMYSEVFKKCTALRSVDIGTGLTQIKENCFNEDNNLETLILRPTGIVTLQTTLNNATGARIPLIYVPSTLIGGYQAGAVWSNYSTNFRSLDSDDRSGRIEDYNDGGNL